MRHLNLLCGCALVLGACSSGEDDGRQNSIYTTTATASDEADANPDTESGGDMGSTTSDGDSSTGTTGPDATCGNGVKEGGEECDGNDLGGLTCVDFGHDNGALICADDCTLFSNACSTCGDGQLAATEACDGSNFGGLTCTDLGYAGGTLSCSADCSQIFENNCMESPACGNGVLDPNEQCDGNNLNGQTCASQGFDGGVLACGNCVFDTSGCTLEQCVPLLGPCNILLQDCCEGLTCGLLICVPEE